MSPPAELATLLRLLEPPDVHAEPRTDDPPGAGPLAAVPWASVGAGPAQLLTHATRRTATAAAVRVAALRRRSRIRVVRPERGSLRTGLRDRLRRRAGSGYVAVRQDGPTLLDRLLDTAAVRPVSDLSVGADGAVRAFVTGTAGRGLLRLGLTGTPADPAHAADGLRLLADSPRVPAVLAAGADSGLRWVVEGLLPGRRPRTLDDTLIDDVAGFLAGLPRSTAEPGLRADAELLASVVPANPAGRLLRAVDDALAALPSGSAQLAHGDLWAGNLLAGPAGGPVTGVVDWDAWAPAGVPGADLLHLLATDERLAGRASLGEVWLRTPWERPAFAGPAARHWPGWADDPAGRRAIGIAWWAGQLAADLRRNPTLGRNPQWIARNVTAVAERL